jgi:hypothetical protein
MKQIRFTFYYKANLFQRQKEAAMKRMCVFLKMF